MSDIVERLRGFADTEMPVEASEQVLEAAAEIEQLRAELALYKQNYARKQLTDSERRELEDRK